MNKIKGLHTTTITIDEYNIRQCNSCHNGMHEGYVIEDGLEYYCSEECLHTKYTEDEYNRMYYTDRGYWTDWPEGE